MMSAVSGPANQLTWHGAYVTRTAHLFPRLFWGENAFVTMNRRSFTPPPSISSNQPTSIWFGHAGCYLSVATHSYAVYDGKSENQLVALYIICLLFDYIGGRMIELGSTF